MNGYGRTGRPSVMMCCEFELGSSVISTRWGRTTLPVRP